MITMRAMILLAAGATVAAGCSAASPDCPPYIAFGLSVRVVDERTETLICDAIVTAREGGYVEALMSHADALGQCGYIGAVERAGTYSVQAEHAGFTSASLSGITVVSSEGDCPHVRPVAVAIRLTPVG